MTDLTGFLNSISGLPDIYAGQFPVADNPLAPRTSVLDQLQRQFQLAGLSPGLAQWVYDQMVQGASGNELSLLLYEQPEFKDRFRALFEYRKNFPSAPAISPSDVLAFERQAAQMMKAAGMPAGFYDHWTDFSNLIANNVSIQELDQRINQGFQRVATAPRMVRESFANFFGPAGDQALAAAYMDPEKAWPALRQQVFAAEAAGAGMNFGFTLGKPRALEIADAGYDYAAARDRFAGLAQMRPLFNETVGEAAAPNLEAEDQGAQMAFGLEGADVAGQQIEQRRKQRVADFGGSTVGTGSGQAGSRGLGAARQSGY